MDLKDFVKIIKSVGIPYARAVFEKKQSLPYIIFLDDNFEGLHANGKRTGQNVNITVELYTKTSDMQSENKLETALKAAGLTYEKSERIINEEEHYLLTYYEINFYEREE